MKTKIIILLLFLTTTAFGQYRIDHALDSWSEHTMLFGRNATSFPSKRDLVNSSTANDYMYGFTYDNYYYIVSYEELSFDELTEGDIRRNLYLYRYDGDGVWSIACEEPLQNDYMVNIKTNNRSYNEDGYVPYAFHYYTELEGGTYYDDNLIHEKGDVIINSDNTITIILVNVYNHNNTKKNKNNDRYTYTYNKMIKLKSNNDLTFSIIKKVRTDENSYLHKNNK